MSIRRYTDETHALRVLPATVAAYMVHQLKRAIMTDTMESQKPNTDTLLNLTCMIASAYLRKNAVPVAEVPGMMRSIYASLTGLPATGNAELTPAKPAIPIKKSVMGDYIVCLEDGTKLKMLRRYLRSRYNLTPEEYRAKWGLPLDYPMTAPNYAAQRSALAKKHGLGRPRAKAQRRKRS